MVRITLDKPYIPIPAPVAEGLELTFDDIVNVPVADASSVSDWNTFFDLPTNGSPFTSVEIDGNTIKLIGGSDITFAADFYYNYNIIEAVDNSGCIIDNVSFYGCVNLVNAEFPATNSLSNGAFFGCSSLETLVAPNITLIDSDFFDNCASLVELNFPLVTIIEDESIVGCESLEVLYFPILEQLGSTVGNNGIFNGISGQSITLTIPAALMTCNAGNPDGDIQYLQANNTVTIVTV